MDGFLSEKNLEDIKDLDNRTIALIGLLVATLISIYITRSQKLALLKILDIDEEALSQLEIFATIILFLVGLYFFADNFKDYKEEPNIYNLAYLAASFLTFAAVFINVVTTIADVSEDGVVGEGGLSGIAPITGAAI